MHTLLLLNDCYADAHCLAERWVEGWHYVHSYNPPLPCHVQYTIFFAVQCSSVSIKVYVHRVQFNLYQSIHVLIKVQCRLLSNSAPPAPVICRLLRGAGLEQEFTLSPADHKEFIIRQDERWGRFTGAPAFCRSAKRRFHLKCRQMGRLLAS